MAKVLSQRPDLKVTESLTLEKPFICFGLIIPIPSVILEIKRMHVEPFCSPYTSYMLGNISKISKINQ